MLVTCKHCKETVDVHLNKTNDAVVCGGCGKEFILEKLMMDALKQNKTTESTSGAEVLVDCPKCGKVEASMNQKNQVICNTCSNPLNVNKYMRRIIMAKMGVNASIV